MVGNVTFLMIFLRFWPVTVNIIDKLQLSVFIFNKKTVSISIVPFMKL